jgi:hypothetical protein
MPNRYFVQMKGLSGLCKNYQPILTSSGSKERWHLMRWPGRRNGLQNSASPMVAIFNGHIEVAPIVACPVVQVDPESL